MINKLTVVLALMILSQCDSAALRSAKKREIIVDSGGFYLGGGANNNIREASQLFDIGGVVANPWINPYTHVLNRPRNILPVGAVGGLPVPVPVPQQLSVPPQPAPQVFQQPQQQQYYQQQQVAPQQVFQQAQPQYQQQVAPQQQSDQVNPIQISGPQEQQPRSTQQQPLQPFTAVFTPGEPVQFKMGLPGDFQNGNYVRLAN